MGFFKDLMKPLDNLSHSAGKGFESVATGFSKSQQSLFGGVNSLMKGLSNPVVLIGIGIVAFFILKNRF